jgi:transcriptional regulator with GAF, ATPase, and Fis domain
VLDRRFRREKSHIDQTLQQMGRTLEGLVDPPALARRLLQASADLLGVAKGSVFLRVGDPPLYRLTEALGPTPPLTELASGCPLVDTLQSRPALLLRAGPSGADAAKGQLRFLGGEVAQALLHEGHLLALLVLGRKDSGPYKADDLQLLAALAQITALALENAERHLTIDALKGDLQAKVEKISEQQRRILALQSQLTKQAVVRELGPAETNGNGEDPGTKDKGQGTADEMIVGSSPAMRQLMQLVRKVAVSPSAVLLRGESGTGKELLAQALHDHSPRAGKAFVKVHCAALAPGLLESELFGHVKGAYTGAHRDKVGRFELADGGTLFLDEIGDISPEVQTKLLRVLQEKTIERVGSTEPVQVNVRILAATHQDLEALIRQGRFREDLFYRINGISVAVPALRSRLEDIPELALHFLRQHAQRCGKAVHHIDDDAMVALKSYSWPGNVRQLENVIERAVVLAEGSAVTTSELPPEVLDALPAESTPSASSGLKAPTLTRSGIRHEREERDQRERERLVRALAAASGNKAEAARALGLARSTLLSRLKKHGLS